MADHLTLLISNPDIKFKPLKTIKLLLLFLGISLIGLSQSWTPGQMIRMKRISSAVISRDGSRVAYTVASSRDGKSQLYLMSIDGGEAEKITSQKNDVGAYAWSPDSKSIAFLMQDTLTASEELDNKEKRDMKVVDKYKNSHLYVLSIQKNNEGKCPINRLTSSDFHVTDINWSPDSRTIAFSHQKNPSADIWSTSDISSVPASGGQIKSLVKNTGADRNPKHSAMAAVKNVKTPTLVIHGANDLRVPVSQGQEFYRALKRLGVPAEMVIYPRTQHGPEEPKFIPDIGERVMKWSDQYLKRLWEG